MSDNTQETIIKEALETGAKTPEDLYLLKKKMSKGYQKPFISNPQLLETYRNLLKNKKIQENKILENLLRIKAIRSLSGIAVVSVLVKPYPCPGSCIYCPTQKGIPKSYLDNEPAVMRALMNKFNPYSQIKMRLQALKNIGHPTDKIELIVIGGTWSYLPKRYQAWFITRCFAACNAESRGSKRGSTRKIKSLKEEQKLNERAKNRMIGLTLETRPDFIDEKEIKRMRQLGATRVEIGVQSIYDDVLELNKRGHGIDAVIRATKLLKDAGFKVCYHMMPNLPGSDIKRDEEMFGEIFSNSNFQPDLLKIYPCAILKESKLYNWWKQGKYKPYSEKELVGLLVEIKKKIPYYCRIQRLIRDIPSPRVVAGPTKTLSNLRQILAQRSKKEGWKCNCIRCREVREKYNPKEKLVLFREDYNASGGKEIFLSFESVEADRRLLSTPIDAERKLYALLRLRIPSPIFSQERPLISVLKNAAIIREVHTYGQLVPVSTKQKIAAQHKGLGKKLIKEAEKIVYTEFGRSAKNEFGLKKMAVISGIGVRNYYRKLGYRLKDTYMIKKI